MQIYQAFVLALGFLTQAQSTRITMDEKAQSLCKKYKMMCKIGKVCAVQHFDWPKNITIPVCIPLSFVPVRNLICQLPPETGRCSARYIRWYYNMHSQECSHFQYGGCNGNQNNFMSKVDCEQSCLSTPSISLYEGGQSALSQMKPSILTAPIYEPPKKTNKYEALNSVIIPGSDSKSDRYQIRRHRKTNRIRTDESNTRKRRRLDKERAKERRRKERRKEKKRQRRLRQERKRKHGKRGKKERRGRKKKKKTAVVETINETSLEKTVDDKQTDVVVEDAKPVISNEIDDDDDTRKEKRKERKRKKRREKLRKKRRLEREGRRGTNDKRRRYAELVRRPETVVSHKLFSILDQ